jgi:hypothetical protein
MPSVSKFLPFALASLSILFLACGDDQDQPDPVLPTSQLLTLNVDASYPTKNIDNWVMVHDKNGVLLGAKKFESGQVVTLETSEAVPDDQISVTLLRYDSTGVEAGMPMKLYTYSNLPKGQEWKLAELASLSASTQVGKFVLNLSGSGGYNYVVSDENTGLATAFYANTGAISADISLYRQSGSTFMVSMEQDGHARYGFIEHVTQGATYSFGVGDLKDFDHTLTVSFPSTSAAYCLLVTYDATRPVNTGFVLLYDPGLPNVSRSDFELGYLDQFKKYYINMEFDYGKVRYLYTRVGDMPKAIDLPLDENFQLQNTGVNNLSLAGSPDYAYRRSNYFLHLNASGVYAAWNIYSPEPGFKMLSFPKELTDVYGFLNVEGFDHGSTTFVIGQEYNNLIDVTYKGTTRGEYEEYGVYVED